MNKVTIKSLDQFFNYLFKGHKIYYENNNEPLVYYEIKEGEFKIVFGGTELKPSSELSVLIQHYSHNIEKRKYVAYINE